MEYYNEASAEIISSLEHREGVIPVQKIISNDNICQGDFVCATPITILSEDLSSCEQVKLNHKGDKKYLESHGYYVKKETC